MMSDCVQVHEHGCWVKVSGDRGSYTLRALVQRWVAVALASHEWIETTSEFIVASGRNPDG